MTNHDKLTVLKGVGTVRAQLFEKLGVDSVGALLHYYPRRYVDYSKPIRLCDCQPDTVCCVRATVRRSPTEHRIRRGMTIFKFSAYADGCELRVTLFNNKYLAAKIKDGEEYIFYGKVTGHYAIREMSAPEIIPLKRAEIRPIYPATEGLASYQIEQAARQVLSQLPAIDDYLPEQLLTRFSLCTLDKAVRNIHFPQNQYLLEAARRRLVFDQLLLLELALRKIKLQRRTKSGFKVRADYSAEFSALLPYTLTNAQKHAIDDSISDMMSGRQMNRLILGDVGSGKTAVAAGLAYTVIKNGRQVALMAPTEILAEQHYLSFKKFFSSTTIEVALLTGGMSANVKRSVNERLASGQIDIVIGTHSLISDGVEFDNLGLAITDEQHRFGVNQRALLAGKGQSPHLLVMSATPIPRTLALMVYGELDVSILDELPAGRQKISTYVVSTKLHNRVFEYIRKHLDAGQQGYIVCPLVEQDDETQSDLVPVEEFYDKLRRGPFANYRLAILHGKMPARQKDTVMRDFTAGQIDLLVATTVVEVGIDVPNATVMVVENAERFGLSQLHQLRGRVGRGSIASDCILISDDQSDISNQRLQALKSSQNGFDIAEADLRLRGPGDFFGHKQHGLPDLKLTSLESDISTLEQSGKCAAMILSKEVLLTEHQRALINERISHMFNEDIAMN